MCGSFTHPDLHFIFPIPSSSKPQESVCDYYYIHGEKLCLNLETTYNGSVERKTGVWKQTAFYWG